MKNILQKVLVSVLTLVIFGSAFAGTPKGVVTADMTSSGFTVLWYSENSESGYIKFGSNQSSVNTIVYDVKGSAYTGKLHKVEVYTGLPGVGVINSQTSYYFSVFSGGTQDNNFGSYYIVKTCPVESIPFPPNLGQEIDITHIYKYLSLNSVANDVIVLVKATKSGVTSLKNDILYHPTSTNSLYERTIKFANFKKTDGTYFDTLSSADKLTFEAWSANDGFISNLIVNAASGSTLDITLNRTIFETTTINDTTPPANVTSASATAGVGNVVLAWTPSISSDNLGTRIVRSTTGYPTTITNGVTIYSQNGSSTVDVNLIIGTKYYYRLFAYDNNGNYSSGVTLSATPIPATVTASIGVMLDNFEDGDTQNKFGHYWYTFNDTGNGGNSVVAMQINALDAANGTTVSNRVNYTLGNNIYADRFAAVATDVTANSAELNMSQYSGLVFYAKGSGNQMNVVLRSGIVTDNDDFVYTINTTSDWVRYIIPFTSFSQSGWGAPKSILGALTQMKAVQFKASSKVSGENGWYRIDEVSFTTSNIPTDNTPPANVTGVSKVVNPTSVALSWTSSTSPDNAGTRVVRSTTTYPTTVTAGATIYNSNGSSYTDSSVSTGVTYYYTLFAYDYSLNYASGVTVSAIPTATVVIPSSGNIFENFEDANYQNNWKYYWYTFSDVLNNGGNSIVTMQVTNADAANGTTYSNRVDYTLGGAYQYRFAGLGADVTANTAELNMSQYTGVEFFVKGNGKQLSVVLKSGEVVDDDDFTYTINSTPGSWTKYTIAFTDFAQAGWGSSKSIANVLNKMKAIQFKASSQASGETGWYRVDEINFINNDVTAPVAPTGVSISVLNDNPVQFKINWTPSVSSDNVGTRVIRKTSGYAVNESDGAFIYQGSASFYNDNMSPLTKNVTYYYTLFAYDGAGNFSVGAKKQVILTDTGLQAAMNVSTNFKLVNTSGVSSNVYNNDYVDGQVTIAVYVTVTPPSSNQLISLNITGAVSKTITFNATSTFNIVLVSVQLTQNTNTLTFQAEDSLGNLSIARSLTVRVAVNESVALKAGSQILPYPAPYNPDNGNLTVAYELNQAANLKMYIYNIAGQLVYKDTFLANGVGGSVGYNTVTVTNTSSFGSKWANGVYIIRLVSSNKIVGTGKFLVIK
ncbi:MAG: hypothetical protein A2Y40_00065 [Candidatus Margulisbacteria bacterium GWF2_35_9]|nr:MAG: hypothetical protein A2Y40_00065 [Candidatus Margulisbacteria bacterium GWF2_35_9]